MGVVDPFPSYLSHNSFRQMADEASGTGVGEEYAFRWTKEQTEMFIKLRGENDELFTGAKNSATVGWRIVLEKMGLSGKVTPAQAKKKWDNLKKNIKYVHI
ncbi:trihelix transcription factor GT-3b-like [Cyprinus carpio]|uniref:Trihelix transcription factor GT-3b-like n=1 Tax=Cyprinus carpio TaxID=7962 RepID=A0A9Q9YE57_CYPCA|nr:trihelix transcription factor GT-3b-like [Cyprinus carpio]